MRVAAATKSRERLKPDIVQAAQIPWPPLGEQERLVGVLRERLAAVARLRRALEAQLAAIEALPAALLWQAFRGSCAGRSDESGWSDAAGYANSAASMSTPQHPLIPQHGGYRRLRAFQVAELIYDATQVFCERFIPKNSRTHDQMVQAARSGRQNIAEGSVGSATSKKGELKLTNIARASLEELRLDYEDFLRQRGLRQWAKDSAEALAVRGRYKQEGSEESVLADVRTASAEVAANTMLCPLNQASYLLRRQIQRLEQDFLEQGGFTERLYGARKRSLGKQESDKSDRSDEHTSPRCPRCGRPMRRRTARQGPKAGQAFWGCTGYPECKGVRPV